MFPLFILIFHVFHHNLHNLYDKKVLWVQPHLKLRNASSLCVVIAIENRENMRKQTEKNILLSMNNLAMNVGCLLNHEMGQLDKIWIQVQHDRESWLKKNKPIYQYLIHQCCFRSLILMWFHINDQSNRTELIREAVLPVERTVNTNVEAGNQPIGWILKTYDFNWWVYCTGKVIKPNQTHFYMYKHAFTWLLHFALVYKFCFMHVCWWERL